MDLKSRAAVTVAAGSLFVASIGSRLTIDHFYERSKVPVAMQTVIATLHAVGCEHDGKEFTRYDVNANTITSLEQTINAVQEMYLFQGNWRSRGLKSCVDNLRVMHQYCQPDPSKPEEIQLYNWFMYEDSSRAIDHAKSVHYSALHNDTLLQNGVSLLILGLKGGMFSTVLYGAKRRRNHQKSP